MVLDHPGPPCIKEEANPASVRRIAATMEYCVLPQRSRADCGVTAGNNAELPSESDAAALSMDELPGLAGLVLRSPRNLVLGSAGIGVVFPSPTYWSLLCVFWRRANGGSTVQWGQSTGSSLA
ncbi:hypothetical protein NDU88_006441 [Pleurodeles waltl]|uniref:Uncharacterized protein n=1 Tax=Pleurodeles waltl TaxID=8319 RepID=A0AAV7WXL2_PLEWA|nr:hypothetical protein NDU88_006441 [Pleurodeles waltl]